MKFNGKTAIVAGGGQGIGAAIARQLAADGAQVMVWDINEKGAMDVAAGISADQGKAKAARVDALDHAKVKEGVEQVVSEFGKLDIMVCSVGGGKFVPFQQCTPEFFQQQVNFNLNPVFNCARAALDPMLERNYGKMLFFTSVTGGEAYLSAYQAGKAGVNSLIQTLVAELAQTRLNINAIMPNLTDTPLGRGSFSELPNGDELWQEYANRPRGINTPESVAKMAAFLVSDEAERLTGQIVAMV